MKYELSQIWNRYKQRDNKQKDLWKCSLHQNEKRYFLRQYDKNIENKQFNLHIGVGKMYHKAFPGVKQEQLNHHVKPGLDI